MRIYTGDIRENSKDRVWDTRDGAPNVICDIAHEDAVRTQCGLVPLDKFVLGRDNGEYE